MEKEGRGGENGEAGAELTAWDRLAEEVKAESDEVDQGDENQEDVKAHHEMLQKAVFENVDVLAVIERTTEKAEKIDLEKLSELRDEIGRYPEIGLRHAEAYFAEILDLSLKPVLEIDDAMDREHLGGCTSGGEFEDRIRLNVAGHGGDVDAVLVTLSHENWHSYQNDVLRRKLMAEKEGVSLPKELEDLAELYKYNNSAYIQADLDYEGYRKQLREVEAETFETSVEIRLRKIRAERQKREEFILQHPEVYGEENLEGIMREVGRILRGFDVRKFLDEVGVGSLDDLWRLGEDEQAMQRYTTALSNLVGLERPVDLKFVDEPENDELVRRGPEAVEMTMSRKGKDWAMWALSGLPEMVWKMRQQEMILNDSGSEQVKLYKTNLEMYIPDNDGTHEAHGRQLLVREKKFFVEEFLKILDEQATLEEIEKMTPEERAKIEEKRVSLGWEPVTSQKYEVRGV